LVAEALPEVATREREEIVREPEEESVGGGTNDIDKISAQSPA